MTRFDDWHRHHPCTTEELWKIQNCLAIVCGFDSPETKAAEEAWRRSRDASRDAA